jgi:Fe-S oxidoreductase
MFWRGKQATPCGAIGGFQFTQPWLAERLARERIKEAIESGAEAIITDDPQCAAHLATYAEGMPVMSLMELVAEAANVEF